jgi:hypothetical protein
MSVSCGILPLPRKHRLRTAGPDVSRIPVTKKHREPSDQRERRREEVDHKRSIVLSPHVSTEVPRTLVASHSLLTYRIFTCEPNQAGKHAASRPRPSLSP